jgi:hypothetical protein
MSMMTREDMLRELELLPVWQLRQPLPQVFVAKPEALIALPEAVVAAPEINTEISIEIAAETAPEIAAAKESLPLRALLSEDGAYAVFLQPAEALADQQAELLLRNMLRAMRTSCRVDMLDLVENVFNQHQPKLIICMGELPANQLLQQSLSLQDWRSQQQQTHAKFQGMPVIVTYSPQHLLSNLQDKALAWQDLCLAMQVMQRLQLLK